MFFLAVQDHRITHQYVGAHQVSAVWCTDLPIHRPTLLDQVDSIAWPGYLSASHLLTRLPPQIGSHAAHTSQLLSSQSSVVGVVSIIASIWAVLRRYGNINPLSIDYACRPRLRSRLTLGGLTWPRNPWSSGGGGFHSSFATHACILTRVHSTTGHPAASQPNTTLPYPATQSHCRGFGGMLEPHYIVGAGPLDQ